MTRPGPPDWKVLCCGSRMEDDYGLTEFQAKAILSVLAGEE